MKIVLVALYDLYSYGIRGLHSVLEKEGHDVKSMFFKSSVYNDKSPTPNEVDEFVKLILSEDPQLIAIGLRSPLFSLFKDICSKIRKNTKAKILVGGHHATADPKSLLPYVDFVCIGEGEEMIKNLCYEMKSGNEHNFSYLPSLIENLDDLEFDYYGNDSIYYLSKPLIEESKMSIYSSRGCFFHCTFCFEQILKNIYGNKHKVRRKSVKRVMDEVCRYKGIFPNLKEIVFSDPNFTWDEQWIRDFSKEYSKTGLSFHCFGNTELVTENMLKDLCNAGMNVISFGIQSASPRMLRKYNRKTTLDKALKVSEMCTKLGLQPRFDFIINAPFENANDWKLTKEFINKLSRPNIIRNFELKFFPGTPLTKESLEQNIISEDYIVGNDGCRFGYWFFAYEII